MPEPSPITLDLMASKASEWLPFSDRLVDFLTDELVSLLRADGGYLLKDAWTYSFAFNFVRPEAGDARRFDYPLILPMREMHPEKTRLISIFLDVRDLEGRSEPNRVLARLLFESLGNFLEGRYKSFDREGFTQSWEARDWAKLDAFPYPAPKQEQAFEKRKSSSSGWIEG